MHQTWILFFIAIFWTEFEPITAQNTLPPSLGIFIDRLTLADASATKTYYADTNRSKVTSQTASPFVYTFNWRQNLPNSSFNYGLSLHNYYDRKKDNILSFKVQLSNVTISGANVQIAPYGTNSAFTILTFNVVLVSTSSSYIELISYTRFFLVLSVLPRSNDSEIFQEVSTKFSFNSSVPIKPYFMLQWIAFNSVMNSKFQQFQFVITPKINTSIIQIKCTSNFSLNNTLNSFKFNILLLNPYAIMPNIATYYLAKSGNDSNKTAEFAIPANFGGSLDRSNCFFGLQKLIRKFDSDNTKFLFEFTNTGNLNIDQIKCEQQTYYTLQILCFGQCPNYHYVNPTNYSICQLCSIPIPNCLNCYSSSYCIQCNSISFLDNNNHSCIPCRNVLANCLSCINATSCTTCLLGWLIDGGCTKVTGCNLLAISQNGTSYCASCDPYFDYNFTSKTCVCKIGRLVNLYCIEDPGCISTYLQDGVVKCGACLITKYFVLDNKTLQCVCKSNFFLNALGQCQQICGDGIVHYLPCDDGNLIDGDGCSSVCRVQILYRCTNEINSRSICRFYGLNFQIQLVDTQKVQNENTGVFTFQFKPKLLNLAKLDLSKYFVFNTSINSYSTKYWTFSNGFAKLYVDYGSDLEKQNATVTFNFDGDYFNHSPIPFDFQVTSRGSKLIYEYRSFISKTIGVCMLAISVAAYLLLFLGSWFNKMIGVEFMQTLQIIYLSHFAIKQYSQGFGVFQYLAFVGINDRFFIGQQINFKLHQNYQILYYNLRNTQATLIGITIFVLLSFIFLCFLHCKLSQLRESKLFKLGSRIMSNFIFPAVLTLTYPYFLLLATLSIKNSINQQALMSESGRSFLVLLSFICYSILLFQFFKYFFLIAKQPKMEPPVEGAKSFYIVSYQIFMYLILASMWTWVRMSYFASSCVLLALLILKLIMDVITKPYYRFIDNFGITMNIGVAIFFLTFTLVFNLQFVQVTEQKMKFYIISVVSLLYFCFIVSLIRVILMIKNRKKELQVQTKNQKDRQKKFDFKDPNQFLLNKQKCIGLNHYRRALAGKDPEAIKQGNTQVNDHHFLHLVNMKKKQFRSKYNYETALFWNKP